MDNISIALVTSNIDWLHSKVNANKMEESNMKGNEEREEAGASPDDLFGMLH